MLPASALPVIVGVVMLVVVLEVVRDEGAVGCIESKKELLGVEGKFLFSSIVAPENMALKLTPEPVSYTHLTLPTTPYV